VLTADVVLLPDGRRIHVRQGGSPDGVPVLFFHGTPDSRLAAGSGDDAARGAGVRLVAFNRPGYGASDPAPSDHLSVADDAAALGDILGLETFAVLGMSLGGQYALACAARHPRRVVAAGVVAAPAVVPELDPPLPRDGLDEEGREFFVRLAARSVQANVEAIRPGFLQHVARIDPSDPDDAALVARWESGLHELDAAPVREVSARDRAAGVREALTSAEGYLRDAAVAFRRWDFRPEDARCPTWLWYGAHDPQAAVRNGVWLAERIPDARLIVRDDTAHLSTLMRHWPEILTTLASASRG
jgi:pimeloyl-ACP methyl ester carboxylesterase